MWQAVAWATRFLFRLSSATFRRRLIKLNLSVTSVCNSRCRTCDIWKEPKRSASTDLTLEDYRQLFANSPRSICWLSITGGEPFLRSDLAAILLSAVDQLPNLSLISLTTNGLNATYPVEVLGQLFASRPKLRVYLNISLDGIGPRHDDLRGVPGNFADANRLRENLRPLQREMGQSLKVTFETTVSRANVDEVTSIAVHAERTDTLHIVSVGIQSPFYRHRKSADRNESLFLKDLPILNFLKKHLANLPVRIGFDHIIRRALYVGGVRFQAGRGRHPVPCAAGRSSVVINAKGQVSPCVHWQTQLGNLKGGAGLEKILAGETTRRAIEEIKKEKCPGCWTPCEATQSLLTNPLRCLAFAIESLGYGKRRQKKQKRPHQPIEIPLTVY